WNGPTTAATRAGTSHPNSTITYNMRQRRRDQAQTPTREKSRLEEQTALDNGCEPVDQDLDFEFGLVAMVEGLASKR
ncbi:hypothetical protein NQ038_15150, partial [Brevibacterium sp. 50QC2O2]|uniref:hypothetical protein n=1 Tax=Brevibacterium moorei TaxID=2968457 RepID=UPI004038A57B|nr:hypothetical protein [Brevibacterium sp. 68QC2CO]MCQ9389962.1 hypothetical protein [Brevibacterium sp. 50QC2O2]